MPARTANFPSVNPSNERLVEIAYDDRGLPITVTERGWSPWGTDLGSSTNDDAFDAIAHTTTLSYESGKLVAIDGPRTDVDDVTGFVWNNLQRLQLSSYVNNRLPLCFSCEVLLGRTIRQWQCKKTGIQFVRWNNEVQISTQDHTFVNDS